MDLSIIIVNYNTGKLIEDCLNSIYQFNYSFDIEVIIVDNNSSDPYKAEIIAQYPHVNWIDMYYNAGFARANNAGIVSATAPVILLLNPDTVFKANSLEKCYGQFIMSNYMACGVQLLNLDGSPQISGNYSMKGGLNYLLPLPFLGPLFKKVATSFKVKPPNVPDSTTTVEVDWINGAFLMVKKFAIERAGMLDEDFFLYAEEAEWCSRLKKTGRLCIYGDCKLIHLQGASSGKTFNSASLGYQNIFDKKGLQIMLSNLVRIRKEFRAAWFCIIMLIYIIDVPVFLLGMCLLWLFKRNTYSINQFNGYVSNLIYVLKLSPTIIRNRPYFYKAL